MFVSFLEGLVPWTRWAWVWRTSGNSDWTATQAGRLVKGRRTLPWRTSWTKKGSDNGVPGSRNERAHLKGLVITGGGVSACEVWREDSSAGDVPDWSLVATHNRQGSGYARAGRKLPAAEFLTRLNPRLTVSKNAGMFNGLNKIRAEVLRCSRNGEGFDIAWKPRCLGAPQLCAEEARDM